MPTLTQVAKALAKKTADAYSFDRYASWTAVVKALLEYGYSEKEVEALVRSKVTRWAADASNKERATAKDVLAYIADTRNGVDQAYVDHLVRESFLDMGLTADKASADLLAALIILNRAARPGSILVPDELDQVRKLVNSAYTKVEQGGAK